MKNVLTKPVYITGTHSLHNLNYINWYAFSITSIFLFLSDCVVTSTSQAAQDPESAETLWEVSEKLVGLENWNPLAQDKGVSSCEN